MRRKNRKTTSHINTTDSKKKKKKLDKIHQIKEQHIKNEEGSATASNMTTFGDDERKKRREEGLREIGEKHRAWEEKEEDKGKIMWCFLGYDMGKKKYSQESKWNIIIKKQKKNLTFYLWNP